MADRELWANRQGPKTDNLQYEMLTTWSKTMQLSTKAICINIGIAGTIFMRRRGIKLVT